MAAGATPNAHAEPQLGAGPKEKTTVKTVVKVIAVTKPIDERAPLDLIKPVKPAVIETDARPTTPPMAAPLLVERSDDVLYPRQPSSVTNPSSQTAALSEEEVVPDKPVVRRSYRRTKPKRVKAASVNTGKTWKRSLSLSFQEGD